MPEGQILIRQSDRSIEASRQIPPIQYCAHSQEVRYSGRRLDGKVGQGALYMGTLAGVLREITHYELKHKLGTRLVVPESHDKTK